MDNSKKKNILYNAVYRCVVLLTPLITSPYLARVLGVEKLGIYAYANTYATYFVLFSLLGVNDYGIRRVAQVKDDRNRLSDNFWQIYYLQFIFTALLSVIYFTVIYLRAKYFKIQLIFGIYVFSSFFEISWFAFGMEEFKLTSIRSIVIRIGIVLCIFLFVKTEEDVWKYALITTLGNVISLLVIIPLVFKYTDFRKPDFRMIFSHLKPNIILFLPVIAASVYTGIAKLMLEMWSTEAEIGYYQNAENIIRLPMFLTTAIVTVFEPYAANLVAVGQQSKSDRLLGATLKYTSVFNLALAFGIAAIAETFVPWFLGAGYARSADLIMILAPMIFVCSFSDVLRYQYLLPNEHDTFSLVAIVAGAGVNILLDLLLIPSMEATGAAIATVVSYLATAVIQFVFINRRTRITEILRYILPFAVFGGLMMGAVFFVRSLLPDAGALVKTLIEIAAGAAVYLAVSFLWMRKNDRELLDMLSGAVRSKLSLKR